MYKINKGILYTTRKYSHYFVITLNGVYNLEKNIDSLCCTTEANMIL